ncbi:hypothetical protein LOZ57_001929 [Ophidiomyces ophidiicola]|uniref:uncharacterized protein n=1 Tax=Ophidiomyces ophidiicola TaxID=1387563 RepID=UPI0020C4A945|nr:uncharacterized protein LOZ57_001929 [Ophidiomyces ophidiicola]KAI1950370.1 hypothetical protein LOZ57_001929 [Ophidiomyces ophidiicola]
MAYSDLNISSRERQLERLNTADQQRATRFFAPWTTWESLTVNISNIPPNANTYILWRTFKDYGTIEWVEIFENQRGKKEGRGKIRFRPPPREVFCPQNEHILKFDDGQHCFLKSHKSRYTISGITGELPISISYIAAKLTFEKEIPVTELGFGRLIESDVMLALRSIKSNIKSQIRFTADFLRREITVFFYLPALDHNSLSRNHLDNYRLRIPFLHISRVVKMSTSHSSLLVIVLASPPLYYRKLNNLLSTFSNTENIWRESDTWFRQTDIPYAREELKGAPSSLRKTNAMINIGRWTAFVLTFPKTHTHSQKLETLENICKDFNVQVQEGSSFEIKNDPSKSTAWKWIDPAFNHSRKPTTSLQDLAEEDYIPLPFPVRYQLEVCISHGFLSEYTISKSFVASLAKNGEIKARELLEHVASEKLVYYDPMKIFDIPFVKPVTGRKIPKYCCYMRTAQVTPSTIYFATPSVDISNRVIRKYIEYSDRFLRVRFTDEKYEGRINASSNNTVDEVFTRIKRTMMNGITLGDRHYEFLAFGNSQFREHGAYFFASSGQLTAASIRAWMGHFSDIREIARHAARLGQCFSTTRAVTGCPVQIVEIGDVERNGHTFSDGVGRISKFLAQMVMTEFKIRTPCGEPPSVFQFRLGGCKGILTVSPEAQRREVHIRKSQYKFPAIHNGLEVIRHSQYCMASLNRQLIIVLSALQVPDGVFIEKLNIMLAKIDSALTDEKEAIHLLQKYIDPNQMTLVLADMVQEGFLASKEPFVTSLLELWRAWQIKYLKEKTKIAIENGACLFGCLDETATLKGFESSKIPPANASYEEKLKCLPEIFVQVSRADENGRYEIIEGICIIARNPSLHPGDIRVVKAVNVPALHHLKDVLVFPQTGDKDLPSMCSGGDLDGDDYLVIWDQDLLPKDWFRQPMDYEPSMKSHHLSRDVTVNDITSFFVMYMKNDRLPQIAHAHLAWADYMEDGVDHEKCIQLAALHSAAVDYNKTGIPATMKKDLNPRKWPHFMEKKHKPKSAQYTSQKILGRLYDLVERVDYRPKLEAAFDERILNSGIETSEQHLKDASNLKVLYDASMRRVMAQHDIKTEFEVWSTFVLSHANMSKDYKFHEEMGQISSALRDEFRTLCFEKAGGKDFEYLAPFAMAMYKVTCNEMTEALTRLRQKYSENNDGRPLLAREEKLPLVSFPWLLQPVLGKIASRHYDPACLEEIGLWTGRSVLRKRRGSVLGNSTPGMRDVETTGGVQRSGEVLELFHDTVHDPWSGLGEKFDKKETPRAAIRDVAPEKTVIVPNNSSQLIDIGEESSPGQLSVESSFSSYIDLMNITDQSTTGTSVSPANESSKSGLSRNSVKVPLDLPKVTIALETFEENSGSNDIIEREGDIKPSAIDELEALLGM